MTHGWGTGARLFTTLIVVALSCTACVTKPVSTATSSDVRLYHEHLERPPWLNSMSDGEIRALVAKSLQTPVDFHGIVVDQEGYPVSDARITFALFDQVLKPFEFPYIGWSAQPEAHSDKRGRFSLTGVTGSALFVRVQKDGYKSVGNSKRHLRYAPRLRYLNEHPLPSENKPMVFVLTPGMALEDYYIINSGGITIPRDGSEIGYRFSEKDPYGVDAGDGDFAFSCQRGETNEDGRWDWSCRIRMKEGSGIQLRHHLVLQEAPEDGYEDNYEWGFSADDENWDHRDERFLYVRLNEGAYYGHLIFKVRTSGDYFFDVDGMINATGSRELETVYHNYND